MAAGLGKVSAARARLDLLVDPLVRVVDQIFCLCALGNAVKARSSAFASFVGGSIVGKFLASRSRDLVPCSLTDSAPGWVRIVRNTAGGACRRGSWGRGRAEMQTKRIPEPLMARPRNDRWSAFTRPASWPLITSFTPCSTRCSCAGRNPRKNAPSPLSPTSNPRAPRERPQRCRPRWSPASTVGCTRHRQCGHGCYRDHRRSRDVAGTQLGLGPAVVRVTAAIAAGRLKM